jgi:hypothetical protein
MHEARGVGPIYKGQLSAAGSARAAYWDVIKATEPRIGALAGGAFQRRVRRRVRRGTEASSSTGS